MGHWTSLPRTGILHPHESIPRVEMPKARCFGTSVQCALPLRHALPEGFVDEDGNLHVSDWLVDRKGFLPIPIVVTEPAVGYGGGLALMFVRNSMRESAEKSRTSDTRRRLTSSCWEPRRPRMGPGSPSAAAWLRLPAVGLEATRKALLTRWTAGSRASRCCAACAPSKT